MLSYCVKFLHLELKYIEEYFLNMYYKRYKLLKNLNQYRHKLKKLNFTKFLMKFVSKLILKKIQLL